MKLKVNDTVQVTAGKDKGRKGKVLKILPKLHRVVVEGMNMYKRHRKAAMGQPGGIVDRPRPLGMGKVALICPKCGKVTRVGYEVVDKKTTKQMNNKTNEQQSKNIKPVKFQKVRVCRKCGKNI